MFARLAAADEDSAAAASFVAERVTLEDMRNWICSEGLLQPLQERENCVRC